MNTMKKALEPSAVDVFRDASLEDIRFLKESTVNPKFAAKCDEFIDSFLQDDEVVEFCSSIDSWNTGIGRAGYRLIRGGLVKMELLVRLN